MFGTRQAAASQLGDDLRGVGHTSLGQAHVGEGVGTNDAQAIVRVGERHAGAGVSGHRTDVQQGALERADLGASTVEETGPEDEGKVLPARAINHRRGVGGIVLAIGIKSHHVAGPAGEGRIEAGLQGSALPQVQRVDRRVGAGAASESGGVVTGGIVHDEDSGKKSAHARDDAPDDGRLIKRGDDDPRVGALLHFSSVAHRAGHAPIVLLSDGAYLMCVIVPTGQHKGDTVIKPSADVASSAQVAPSARVWHLAQVRENARIGEETIIGRGAYIGEGVRVGARCKIQNYALVYEPASLADGVFVGPAAVFTNDHCPRAINPDGTLKSASDWDRVGVTVEHGAAIGARAVCVAPVRIGAWASVGAGSVVTRDVAPYALVVGVPARRVGWVGEAGVPLVVVDPDAAPDREAGTAVWVCPASGRRYIERNGTLTPEETQASSPNTADTQAQTREDHQ